MISSHWKTLLPLTLLLAVLTALCQENPNAGRLPDGQVYVINNVLPLSTKKGGRSLLAISLSRDGLNFDRMAVLRFLAPDPRYEGRSKSVGYAYPHSTIVENNLWVIYSVNKEDIEIARIPLSKLAKLK